MTQTSPIRKGTWMHSVVVLKRFKRFCHLGVDNMTRLLRLVLDQCTGRGGHQLTHHAATNTCALGRGRLAVTCECRRANQTAYRANPLQSSLIAVRLKNINFNGLVSFQVAILSCYTPLLTGAMSSALAHEVPTEHHLIGSRPRCRLLRAMQRKPAQRHHNQQWHTSRHKCSARGAGLLAYY